MAHPHSASGPHTAAASSTRLNPNDITNNPLEIEFNDIHPEKKLGEGCFGAVYKGACYQKEVAIKIPLRQNLDEKTLTDLRNEIEIMRANPHPNIVLFMGACTVPGKLRLVTELMDGDLETLLMDRKKALSLYLRLRMAKDAALGLNWLHRSKPSFIHRDLKPANLLHDINYHVKVCDFGLAAIKPRDVLFLSDGADGAKGTPLWMAPEVMMGQEFDEKADVYSYGIVLWQILAREEPFTHHTDFDEFMEAVCKRNERPPISSTCLPSLRVLIERCWHADPNVRPTMEEVVRELDYVLVDAAIADAMGRRFWKENFLKSEKVLWEDFVKKFYTSIGARLPDLSAAALEPAAKYLDPNAVSESGLGGAGGGGAAGPRRAPLSIDQLNLLCLKEILADPPDREKKTRVDIEKFGNILEWFGPILAPPLPPPPAVPHPPLITLIPPPHAGFSLMDKIRVMMSKQWFHGDIDTTTAQNLLAGKPPGAFLVRFSSQPGCYTISRVSPQRSIAHIRISYNPSLGFSVNDDHHWPVLDELIERLATSLNLHTPCPGSRFAHLFEGQQHDLAGYEVMP